jgi:uncharacterized protein with GYD domain
MEKVGGKFVSAHYTLVKHDIVAIVGSRHG